MVRKPGVAGLAAGWCERGMLAIGDAAWQARPVALSDRDRAILDFERGWWLDTGPKKQAIEIRLRISPALYYRRLSELIGSDEAMGHDPLVIRRLRRLRHQRLGRRFGAGGRSAGRDR